MGVGSSDVTTFLLTPVKKYLFWEILEYLHRSKGDSVRAARYIMHFSLRFWLSSFSYYRKYVGQSGILRRFGRSIIILKFFSRKSFQLPSIHFTLSHVRKECLFESVWIVPYHMETHLLFLSWRKPSFTSMIQCKHSQISTKLTIFRPLKRPSYVLKTPIDKYWQRSIF